MKTILVPTDFSDCSANAVKYAIHFAEKTERKLLFFHSTFLPILTSSSTLTYLSGVKSDKESKLFMLKEFIEEIYSSLKIVREENSTKFLVKFGPSVLENIAELINEQFIDLIIMGTHGATGFKKAFIGSNTASVIEKSYCPVLAIPPKYTFDEVKTIAYACSDLNNLKKELKKIIPLAQKMAASLLIFHVAASAQSLLENKKFESETFIKSISHHFKFDNISLSVIDVGDNSLVEAIEKFVKHNRPNLLTMRIHKRNFLKKIFEPSKTKEISYHLSIPLMAVKWKK